MRIYLALAAVLASVSCALAEDDGRATAILVRPIHEAQVVRGDDGMDHVEYELLVVSVFSEPVTLSSVTVLDPNGKELARIDGSALAAATQTLFSKTPSPVIPASAAVSVDVDLVVPPGGAPERVTHRIAYTLEAGSQLAPILGSLEVSAPGSRCQPKARSRNRAASQGKWLARHHRLLQAQRPPGRTGRNRRRPYRDGRNLCGGLGQGQERQDLRRRRQEDRAVLWLRRGRPRGRRRRGGFRPRRHDRSDAVCPHGPEVEVGLWRQQRHGGNRSECLRLVCAFAPGQHRGEGGRHGEGGRAYRQIGKHRPLGRAAPPSGSARQAGPSQPGGACRSSSTVSPWSAQSISTLRRGIDWWSCQIRARFAPPIRSTAAL